MKWMKRQRIQMVSLKIINDLEEDSNKQMNEIK
jgi:hypothetical protein